MYYFSDTKKKEYFIGINERNIQHQILTKSIPHIFY